MKTGGYEVTLKRKKGKYLPKKILRHEKFKVTDYYSFNVSLWVADTPQSNLKPTVNLVLQHNGDKVRLCFPDAVSMCLVMKELTHWLDDLMVQAHEAHTEAVREFLEFHGAQLPPSLNDYTVSTVIHEGSGKRKGRKTLRVNTQTGEILDEKLL